MEFIIAWRARVGRKGTLVPLPMSHTDIANYLRLTIEIVTLTGPRKRNGRGCAGRDGLTLIGLPGVLISVCLRVAFIMTGPKCRVGGAALL